MNERKIVTVFLLLIEERIKETRQENVGHITNFMLCYNSIILDTW